jgi:hypothetical protein
MKTHEKVSFVNLRWCRGGGPIHLLWRHTFCATMFLAALVERAKHCIQVHYIHKVKTENSTPRMEASPRSLNCRGALIQKFPLGRFVLVARPRTIFCKTMILTSLDLKLKHP